MQYQKNPKNNNDLHLPPVPLLYHVFGKRVAINGRFFRSPFISAASEQHLKLLEARFAALCLILRLTWVCSITRNNPRFAA